MKFRNLTHGIVGRIALACAELIVGVLLIVNPEMFMQAVVVGVGVLLIALGLTAAIKYFFTPAPQAAMEQSLAKGLIFILIGFILALRSTSVIDKLEGLYTIFGVVVGGLGLLKLQWAVDLLRIRQRRWYATLVSSVLSVLFGLLIVLRPGAIHDFIGIVTGVFLIIAGVLDIAAMVLTKLKIHNPNEIIYRSNAPKRSNAPDATPMIQPVQANSDTNTPAQNTEPAQPKKPKFDTETGLPLE